MTYDPTAKLESPISPTPQQRAAKRFVYFIQGARGSPIKIGVAAHVHRRMAALQVGYPTKLRLLGVCEPEDPILLERELHVVFGPRRLNGEWFEAGAEVVEWISKNARPLVLERGVERMIPPIAFDPAAFKAARPRGPGKATLANYKAARGITD